MHVPSTGPFIQLSVRVTAGEDIDPNDADQMTRSLHGELAKQPLLASVEQVITPLF